MNSNGALGKILQTFERYYNISTQDVAAPFVAEATFCSHNEQYFIVKAAKVADIDSNEYVFFYSDGSCIEDLRPAAGEGGSCQVEESHEKKEMLSPERIDEISRIAWERGLSKIKPYYGHRNTDVTLVILSDRIAEESFRKIKKLNHYKSYKFGLYGWSSFRALAYETSTGRAVTNRRGSDLKKLVASL